MIHRSIISKYIIFGQCNNRMLAKDKLGQYISQSYNMSESFRFKYQPGADLYKK